MGVGFLKNKGAAKPPPSFLLSDSDVAHNLGLLSRNLLKDSGQFLLKLVQVDDGGTDAVGNPLLDVAIGSTTGDHSDGDAPT